jgi:hypothetical protein
VKTARAPELPDAARRVLWDQLWTRLLSPPRQEPAEAEHIATPEEVADPEPRSRGEERQ